MLLSFEEFHSDIILTTVSEAWKKGKKRKPKIQLVKANWLALL